MKFIKPSNKNHIESLVRMSISFWNEKPKSKRAYFIRKHQSGELYVYEKDGVVEGYIVCLDNYWENCNFIDEIGVDREYRNKGIASLLLNHAIRSSKKQNRRRLFSSFNPENISSFKLHLKNGFSVDGHINNMFTEGKTELIVSIKL
jgi:L-amino acid N-acyltransferase YncA